MRNSVLVIFLAIAPAVFGADLAASDNNAVPLVRIGAFFGRSGVAVGPTIEVEVSPFKWLGGYVFLGNSSVSGYQTQGVTAAESGRDAGVGLVGRFLRFRSVSFGVFSQAGYSGDKTVASYIDPVYGPIQYRSSDKNPNVTLGLDVEYRIRHGLFGIVRVGRNLGDGYAATEGGGFSLNAGIAVDPTPGIRFFRRLF